MKQDEKLLIVSNLTKKYKRNQNQSESFFDKKDSHGIMDINFKIGFGEIFGVAGESGAGKSTLGRIIAGWDRQDSGSIEFKGKEIQYVCQDPYGAVNPRWSVAQIIEEPWVIKKRGNKQQRLEKMKELLSFVELNWEYLSYFPEQLSGGQLQRVIIARSLMLSPDLLIADEITASLDVTVQKQMMKLLWKLNQEKNMACLIISHDLELLRHMCKNIAILSQGKLVESGNTKSLWQKPKQQETKELLQAMLKF